MSYQGTREELRAFSTLNCPAVSRRTVSGTVAGLAGSDVGLVTIDGLTKNTSSGQPAFSLADVPSGPISVLAQRQIFTGTDENERTAVDRVILRRNIDPGTSPMAVLDFNSSEAFAPAAASLTVSNGTVGAYAFLTNVIGRGYANVGGLLPGGFSDGRPPHTYYAIPTNRLLADDWQGLTVFALNPFTGSERSITTIFRTAVDRTIALGAELAPYTTTVVEQAPLLLRVSGPIQPDYPAQWDVTFSQTGANPAVLVISTAAAQASSSTYTIQAPNLRGLAGYDAAWELRAGLRVEVNVAARSRAADSTLSEGLVIRNAQSTSNIRP